MENNEEVKNILSKTPFKSYMDLFSSVYAGKATLLLSNSACRQITQIVKPIYANMGIFLGFIPSLILTIWYSIQIENFWFLFLILLELILPHLIYFFQNFNCKIHYIAYFVILLSFFIDIPAIIFLLVLILLFSYWGVTFWKRSLYKEAIQILSVREDVFVWAYNSNNLSISDCFGNLYYKFKE